MPKVVLLRRKELGDNCHHVADAFPGLEICQPNEVPIDTDWVIRWGTTTNLPGKSKVINKAGAIHETTDKRAFRKKMADAGVAPRTWLSYEQFMNDPFIAQDGYIIRPTHHERSQELYHFRDENELQKILNKKFANEAGFYISEFIDKQKEYRVFIVQGRVILVYDKEPEDKNDLTWGLNRFLYMRWSKWPMYAVEAAVKAFNLSNLDFGAVDVICRGGKAYCLEINTAPEVWGYYGERLAAAFQYMINVNRERIPTAKFDTWKDTAHPTLLEV